MLNSNHNIKFKKFQLLFLILLFNHTCFSQRNIIIPLEKTMGHGITWILSKRIYQPKTPPKVPSNVENYRLFSLDLNSSQGVVDRIVTKSMTHEDSLYYKDIDITNYSKTKISHEIIFLSGKSKDNKNSIIIPDRNSNMDFTDDTILVFDLSKKTVSHGELDNFEGLDLSLEYESFYYGKVLKREVNVTIYHHSPNHGSPNDPNVKDYIMFVTNNELRKGTAIINNDCLTFYTSSIENYDDYSQNYVQKFDTCGLDMDLNKGWVFRDSLIDINNVLYESSVSKFGDTLFLKEVVGKRSKNLPTDETLNRVLNTPKTLLSNKPFQLSEFKGQYILLNFWGTWCQPCVAELPQIKELNERLDKNKIKLLGIACDQDINKVQIFLKTKGYSWDQTFESINPQQETNWSYLLKISEYPHWILIDLKGEIVLKKNIPYDKLVEVLKQRQLLK